MGMVAAIAIAALVGGVSGAGVTAVLSRDGQTGAQSGAPSSTITVNDPGNATAITGAAATAAPSVVTLSVDSQTAAGSGSGVIISEDGYVLTNAHVATLSGEADKPRIQVQTADGRLFPATLVGSDPIADLAVVKIEAGETRFEAAEFANSDKLNVGDTVVAMGAPLGLANTVTSGIVSALNRSITVASSAVPETEEQPLPSPDESPFDFWQFPKKDSAPAPRATSSISLPVIQTDAAINPGNSGGALLDGAGKVIGINVAIASTGGSSNQSTAGSIGVGFAIPANYAQRVADDIIADGRATHGRLGAEVADVTEDPATTGSATVGSSIHRISPGGAADKAGLRQGDVVTRFNGKPISGKVDLTAQVRVLPGGAEAELDYVRNGKKETVTVTLDTL